MPIILSAEFHEQRSLAGYTVHGVARVGHDLATKLPPNAILGALCPLLYLVPAATLKIELLLSLFSR